MWFPIVVRIPFAIAGVVAGWFFADGTLRYDVVQMGVALGHARGVHRMRHLRPEDMGGTEWQGPE